MTKKADPKPKFITMYKDKVNPSHGPNCPQEIIYRDCVECKTLWQTVPHFLALLEIADKAVNEPGYGRHDGLLRQLQEQVAACRKALQP